MATKEDQALDSLFDSNIPPSSQQHSIAQAAIESFNQKLTAVKQRIADLQSQQLAVAVNQLLRDLEHQLVELQAEKKVIEARKQKYLDVVSARRRIPTEIVGAFIESACPNSPTSLNGLPPFLPFMLVSRGWYHAVCDNHRLWAALDVDLRSDSEGANIRRVVDMVTRWHSRAGSLPLTLSLSLSSSNPNNHIFIDYLNSIVTKLGALDLKIEMASSSDLTLLRPIFRDPDSKGIPWPRMKKLHLTIRSKSGLGREIQLSDVFPHPYEQFPALENFAIRSNGTLAKFNVPWDALTTLRLGPFSIVRGVGESYRSILGSCQNLRSLHVGIEPQAGFDTSHFVIDVRQRDVKVTLPHLTELSVEHGLLCDPACKIFIESLILPSLQSFSFKYTGPPSTGTFLFFPDPFTELVIRSHNPSTIKSLSLDLDDALSGPLEDFGRLFREVPGLEVLELSGDEIDIGLMEMLPEGLKELTLRLAVDTANEAFTKYLNDNAPQRPRVYLFDGIDRQPEIVSNLRQLW